MDNNLAVLAPNGQVSLPAAPDRLALPPHNAEPAGSESSPDGRWYRRKPLIVLAAVAIGIACLFVAGLVPRLRDRSSAKTNADGGLPTVNFVVAHPASAETEVVLPGAARADEEPSILARTNGYLEKWLVDIGDRVAEGQLMALIAAPEVDQELLQNRATLLQTQASVVLSQATLEQLKATRVLNKQTFDRTDATVKSGASSTQEYDTTKANLQTSEANVAAGVASVGVANANVRVAEANVHRLEQLVSFKRVLATSILGRSS